MARFSHTNTLLMFYHCKTNKANRITLTMKGIVCFTKISYIGIHIEFPECYRN